MQKQTFGESIIEGLSELADALDKKGGFDERFTRRRVVLNLDHTDFKPKAVRETRAILGASQAIFARFLGVSTKTVQAWESGRNSPNEMACRFLDEIRVDPAYWKKRLRSIVAGRASPTKKHATSK
ncbi:MAG: transcriptional regulator [Planctomycetes bacterium]|nr:transcriptional regulator [Planctomycetota bacterium]